MFRVLLLQACLVCQLGLFPVVTFAEPYYESAPVELAAIEVEPGPVPGYDQMTTTVAATSQTAWQKTVAFFNWVIVSFIRGLHSFMITMASMWQRTVPTEVNSQWDYRGF